MARYEVLPSQSESCGLREFVGARGLPARLILSLGAMGWGVGQDSRILPAPSLRIWEFVNFVPGSVAYVELVDA